MCTGGGPWESPQREMGMRERCRGHGMHTLGWPGRANRPISTQCCRGGEVTDTLQGWRTPPARTLLQPGRETHNANCCSSAGVDRGLGRHGRQQPLRPGEQKHLGAPFRELNANDKDAKRPRHLLFLLLPTLSHSSRSLSARSGSAERRRWV